MSPVTPESGNVAWRAAVDAANEVLARDPAHQDSIGRQALAFAIVPEHGADGGDVLPERIVLDDASFEAFFVKTSDS